MVEFGSDMENLSFLEFGVFGCLEFCVCVLVFCVWIVVVFVVWMVVLMVLL